MAKTRLLPAVCTVVMLAAAPAFAQTNTQTGDTGVGGTPNNPTNVAPTTPDNSRNTMPASGSHADKGSHSRRSSAMLTGHYGSMHARNDLSQDAAIDRLNDQSFQAARTGQAYSGGGSGSSAPTGDASGK